MTTRALFETCMNYPVYQIIFFYNFVYGAMQSIAQSLNGFSELYEREDAPELLSSFYTQTDWVSYLQDDPTPGWHLTWFEYILAEERLVKELNERQKEQILSTALKFLTDDAMKEKFDGRRSTILLIGRILLTIDTCRATIEQFDSELPDWLGEGELQYNDNGRASFLVQLASEHIE